MTGMLPAVSPSRARARKRNAALGANAITKNDTAVPMMERSSIRLSDKYGRRPMLLLSIIGTAVSFFVMAFAPSAAFLFLARALDGLTAGNIPVIFAVISDTTKPQECAKAFGFIGSAFSFGFIFGPAIAALTLGYGSAVPFLIAGVITIIATIFTALYLPETNQHMGEVQKGKLFDFPMMWKTLFDPNVGVTFVI